MTLRHLLVASLSAVGLLAGCGTAAPDPVAATLRLEIDNCRGLAHQRATAVRVADDLAVTVAHSLFVDGEFSVGGLEVFTSDGQAVTAELAYIDSETDLALLRLDEPGPFLALASFDDDSSARFVTFASSDGPVSVRTIDIARLVEVTLDGGGARQALELDGVVAPGDSGSPVLDDDGAVLGIVFAASKTADVGWAVASLEVRAALLSLEDGAGEALPALVCP